ncbi:hypothetical protein C0992_009850 [Termitomyces sp. T32_za158]|nr:hypothetical protein C0992_009850 [Termitomyces sp. T32_za158]
MTAYTILQTILTNRPAKIPVRRVHRKQAGTAVEELAASLVGRAAFVGFAVQHNPKGRTKMLALATVKEVLQIFVDGPPKVYPRDSPFEDLLSGNLYTLVGFDMGRLAVRIEIDLNYRVRGIDLSTAFRANAWDDPPLPSDVVKSRLFEGANPALVDSMWINEQGPPVMCLRAWLAACVAENNALTLQSAVRLDTDFLSSEESTFLAELVRQARVLDGAKPKETPGEFTKYQLCKDGKLKLQNARYKTRIQRGQVVIVTNTQGQEFSGVAHGSRGKTTYIHFIGQALSGYLAKVRVLRSPGLTSAEKARNELVLRAQQGLEDLYDSFFIQMLWFPTEEMQVSIIQNPVLILGSPFEGLNPSQEAVALKMISDCPLVVAHGPPGTGKTTTIAAAVSVWEEQRHPTWIVAHSNVAVKNMAEKLFEWEVDFRILVSKEFHFEWHEHLYEGIREKVLVSDQFLDIKDRVALSRLLGRSCIILSTLGMLSNPTLHQNGMFEVVPVGRLVVDEASQIKIEDFLHILHRFRHSLGKLCFFGDPKQRMVDV